MVIGGLRKFSLIDYPGKTSAVVFTVGCDFRCRYCHNPELVIPEKYAPAIPLSEIYDFLESRRGKLDGVCVTGGEPTLHKDLPETLEKIKAMGFSVKLDSNGGRPEALKNLIDRNLVDYIAMDIKAPFEDYPKITGRSVSAEKLKESVGLIMKSGVEYEFRTTVVKSLTNADDLLKIAKAIKGAEKYYLQKFVPAEMNDPSLSDASAYSDEELAEFARRLEMYVKKCHAR